MREYHPLPGLHRVIPTFPAIQPFFLLRQPPCRVFKGKPFCPFPDCFPVSLHRARHCPRQSFMAGGKKIIERRNLIDCQLGKRLALENPARGLAQKKEGLNSRKERLERRMEEIVKLELYIRIAPPCDIADILQCRPRTRSYNPDFLREGRERTCAGMK